MRQNSVGLAATIMALGVVSIAGAQDCIDGACFVDRGATGEVVLGAMRGGHGVIDYDGDGYPDLVVADSAGKVNRLFRNVDDLDRPGQRTFVDVTAGSGLDDADGTTRDGVAVLAADYDNDGDADVFLVGREPASGTYGLLYRNDGGGKFTNVSVAAGVRRSGNGAESAAWVDFDLDGNLDLFVVRTTPSYLLLLRNNGDGTFSDASAILPSIPGFSHCYAALWMDYDRDGWPDALLLSNAGAGTDVALHNVADGAGGRKFVNVAAAIGFTALGPAPMGIASGDFDLDGDLDVGISDAATGTYYRNDGGTFAKFVPFGTMFGWGVAWIDVDNDARLDFYTAGSWGASNPDNLQRNVGGGAFANQSSVLNGVSAPSQHSVQIDFNNDGRRDLITMVPNSFVSVFENVSTAGNHWFGLRLRGVGAGINRDAVGAFVTITAGGATQVREVVNGSSTTATEDQRLHFGLGAAAVVDEIQIVWPRSGDLAARSEVFSGPFAADQYLTLTPQAVCADLNGDGLVSQSDLGVLLAAYSLRGPAGDLDGDDDTDQADLGILLAQFGKSCP